MIAKYPPDLSQPNTIEARTLHPSTSAHRPLWTCLAGGDLPKNQTDPVKSCGVVSSFCVLRVGLCAECEWGVLLLGGLWCESRCGEDVETEVASAFGPFVVLFGEDGSHQADDGLAVGEDSHGVGASADVAVEALTRVVGPDLGPHPGGEACEREDVCSGLIEVITHGGELVVHVVQEPVVLSVDRCGVGLATPSAASL